MHTYATDAKDRETIPAILAALAVIAALLFNFLIGVLRLQVPWWFDAPAVMGFYGIFHKLYDTTLWRYHLSSVRFSSIPDISGVWVGILKTSYNSPIEIPAVIYINQTWSKISIKLETEHSRSFSTMAALNTDESAESGLKYEYLNEPAVFGVPTLQSHRGTAHLRISFNCQEMEGDYYTGRGRQNIGTISLQFISREHLKREEALKQLSIYKNPCD